MLRKRSLNENSKTKITKETLLAKLTSKGFVFNGKGGNSRTLERLNALYMDIEFGNIHVDALRIDKECTKIFYRDLEKKYRDLCEFGNPIYPQELCQ